MTRLTFSLVIFFYFLLSSISADAQKYFSLPRSTPESEGVSSQGILDFLAATGKSTIEFHSYMILRHGKVIAEGWWNPYRPDLKHTMYSVSKSFTATAVGFAVTEGRLKVSDKVISFFPANQPVNINQELSALTVKDLLTMSAGQQPDPTSVIVRRDSNWVKGFLSTPVQQIPGSTFLYNSLATYMLSAIVQKVTGEKIIDYLKPRLFDPLGIENIDWETDAMGINTGGWGLRVKTEDMARFGQLFLQKGKWNGKQILPQTWVQEASEQKIIQHPALSQAKKDSSDWEQGYAYQMWRSRHNSYRGDGAFGQFILILPDQDAVIVITAETPYMQDELNLVWKYLLPAMQNRKLSPDKKRYRELRKKTSSLKLSLPVDSVNSPARKNIPDRNYSIAPNVRNIKSLAIQYNANQFTISFTDDTASYRLPFSKGNWNIYETNRPGPYLLTGAKHTLKGLPPFKVAAAYSWKNENILECTLRYIESPHKEIFIFRFTNHGVSVDIKNSLNATETFRLKGTIIE